MDRRFHISFLCSLGSSHQRKWTISVSGRMRSNFLEGLREIIDETGNDTFEALVPPGFDPTEMHRAWKDGVDTSVMDDAIE